MLVVVAVGLSLVSAICYAAGAVTQERIAAKHSLLASMRHLRWWIAVALSAVGGALHLVALRYGPLTIVQPLGALTLVLALPAGAMMAARRVAPAEWRGAIATVVGLAGMVLLTASAVPTDGLDTDEIVTVLAWTAGSLAVLFVLAARIRAAQARGLLYAAASGIAFGISSALSQTVTVRVADDGVTSIADPVTVAIAVLTVTGLLLSQAAYRYGLAGPLATATLANPIAAAIVGMAMLGERLAAGALATVVVVAAAGLAAYGVTILSRTATPEPAAAVPVTATIPAGPPAQVRRNVCVAVNRSQALTGQNPVPASQAGDSLLIGSVIRSTVERERVDLPGAV